MAKDRSGFFAARLKELRAAAGFSQSQLAEAADVPVSTIRGFEIGRREPTFATLLKLADGLGVSLAAFEATAEEPAKGKSKGRKHKE